MGSSLAVQFRHLYGRIFALVLDSVLLGTPQTF